MFKKIILSLIVLLYLIGTLSLFCVSSLKRGDVDSPFPKDHPIYTSAFEKIENPYRKPIVINIQSIGSMLKVEDIGLYDDGSLAAPDGWDAVGWYRYGARAGQSGNVVINGHYDTDRGEPAAFWELKKINIGDKVTLTDEFGRSFVYEVTSRFYVDVQDPKKIGILGGTFDPKLTLITCGGVWDDKAGAYNKRLIVRADLIPNG